MIKDKMITVILMTYNQINYIAVALDAILAQEIDVGFDILIHDDSSTDGTYDLLLDYKKKHPDLITIIHQNERQYLKIGFNRMIYEYIVPHINSKYVAYCDGDDYWIDNKKLKKQYLFMENNPDYQLCFHSTLQLKQDGDMTSRWYIGENADYSLEELINEKPGLHIATSSIFVRSEVFKDFPNWRLSYPVEDFPLYINACINGKIFRMGDVMAVYRQYSNGSWSSYKKKNKPFEKDHLNRMISSIKLFDIETCQKYHSLVIKHIEGLQYRLALLDYNSSIIFSSKYKRFLKDLSLSGRIRLRSKCFFNRISTLFKNSRKKE